MRVGSISGAYSSSSSHYTRRRSLKPATEPMFWTRIHHFVPKTPASASLATSRGRLLQTCVSETSSWSDFMPVAAIPTKNQVPWPQPQRGTHQSSQFAGDQSAVTSGLRMSPTLLQKTQIRQSLPPTYCAPREENCGHESLAHLKSNRLEIPDVQRQKSVSSEWKTIDSGLERT